MKCFNDLAGGGLVRFEFETIGLSLIDIGRVHMHARLCESIHRPEYKEWRPVPDFGDLRMILLYIACAV